MAKQAEATLVRSILSQMGFNMENKTIYNDKRNVGRRIKIFNFAVSGTDELQIRAVMKEAFGERFVAAQHVVQFSPYGSRKLRTSDLCIYLNN